MFRKLHLTVTQVRSGLNELNEAAVPQCSDLLDCILFTVVCFCFLLVKKRERISDELSSEPGTLLLSHCRKLLLLALDGGRRTFSFSLSLIFPVWLLVCIVFLIL